MPIEGVVAIGLLGAVAVAAAVRERRRRQAVEAFHAAEALGEGRGAEGVDLGAADEQAVVEEETVATIDYEGLDAANPDE